MIRAIDYFKQYIAYEIGTISNDNLMPHDGYYETYERLDEKLLEIYAEDEKNPAAMEELGERALFFEKNTEKAIQYLERASDAGHGEASELLSQIYRNPKYGKKDMDLAMKFQKLSAEQGSPMGMYNLSCAYFKGRERYEGYGFDKSNEKAFHWSVRAMRYAMEMTEFIFNNRCSKGFESFVQRMLDLIGQTTCINAEQLIDGNGMERDIDRAKSILIKSQNFFQKYIGQSVPDFEKLLKECELKQT